MHHGCDDIADRQPFDPDLPFVGMRAAGSGPLPLKPAGVDEFDRMDLFLYMGLFMVRRYILPYTEQPELCH